MPVWNTYIGRLVLSVAGFIVVPVLFGAWLGGWAVAVTLSMASRLASTSPQVSLWSGTP